MYYRMYRKNVEETLDAIFTKETDGLEKAGQMLAQVLENGGLLYVFGCGHSHMLAEELFYRAGGLAPVYPIFETAAMLHEGAAKSSQIERMSGYAQHVIARYPIGPKDCLLIASTSGINPFGMEMAQLARERGAKVIGISSGAYVTQPSRQKDGLHLPDFCDICIDNHVPLGDATVTVCADGTKAGPVSTIATLAIANSLVLDACEIMKSHGVEPKVFHSGNCPGADGYNAALLKEYMPRVRHL